MHAIGLVGIAFFFVSSFAGADDLDSLDIGKRHDPNVSPEQIRRLRVNEVDTERLFIATGTCNGKTLKDILRSFECKTRPRMVKLAMPSSSEMIVPNHVEINQCEGHCSYIGHSCMAVNTRQVKIPVLKTKLGGGRECGIVVLEEDTSCTCGCIVKKTDCHAESQVYNKNRCRCDCVDQTAFELCRNMGRIWEGQTCSCHCPEVLPCSTGEVFVHELCRCKKYMDNDVL